MAATLKYTVTETGFDGVVDLIEIYQEGSHSTTALISGSPFITEDYGSPGHDIDEVFRGSEVVVNIIVSSTELTDLRTIKSATGRQWSIVYKKDGAAYWYGWIVPELFSHQIIDDRQVVQLVARDRLASIERQDYVDASGDTITGKQTFREAIGFLLKSTSINGGAGLSFAEESRAKPAAEAGNPLDLQFDRERFYEQKDDIEKPVYANKRVVFESLLKTFFLTCVQYNGKWRLLQPTTHLSGATLTRRTYTASGETLSTTATPASYVDLDDYLVNFRLYADGSDREQGAGKVLGESSVTYDPGPYRRGGLFNGNFGSWPDGRNAEPAGWSYSGSATDILRFEGVSGDIGQTAGILARDAADANSDGDSTLAEQKTAVNQFMTRSLGNFSTTTASDMRLQWLHLWSYDPDANEDQIGVSDLQAFVRIKLVGVSNTYYWVAGAVPHQGSFQIVAGDDQKHPCFNTSVRDAARGDWIEIDSLPVSGEMFMELGTVALSPSDKAMSAADVYCRWGKIQVVADGADTTGEDRITYTAVDSTIEEGEVESFAHPLGDGPYDGAQGAIFRADGTTLTSLWARKVGATQVPHTQMLAEEPLVTKRDSRGLLQFDIPQMPTGLTPTTAFDYNSVRYWPVHMRIERPRGLVSVTGIELKENTGAPTTTATTGGTGVFGFGGDAGRIFIDLSSRIGNAFLRGNITTTNAIISAGAQTSATIVPVNTKFAKSGEVVTIVDRVLHTQANVTLSADYSPTSVTLSFDAKTFDIDFKSGSYVFTDFDDVLTKVIIAEAGLTVIVEARQLTQLDGAIAAGTTLYTLTGIELTNFEVLDQELLALTDSVSGTVYTFYANGQQAAALNSLAIEATAGGDDFVTFDLGAGDNSDIQLARDTARIPAELNVFFSGIVVEAKTFKTSSWDGTVDANGVITAPGTQGWCLTGVSGQPGDADITGTFTGAGGTVRIDKTDGLQIIGTTSKTDGRTIQFVDALGSSPTREYLGLWVDTDLDEAFVESDTSINLKSNTSGGAILSLGASGFASFTSTAALHIPTGTTAQEPAGSNGDIRYDSDTNKFRGKENGAWVDIIGAGAGDVTAAANMTDHAIIRGDGGAKGVQDTGVTIDDSDAATFPAQVNIQTQAYFTELASDPAATAQGTFVYSKTDNRLYFANGSPQTVHLVLSDDDIGTTVGDVFGPASSTNLAVVRFSGTGGETLLNSGVTIDGSNNIVTAGSITGAAITAQGNFTAENPSFLEDQVNISNQIKFTEIASDPTATAQGTFIYGKTDNRLYFANGSPQTVYKVAGEADGVLALSSGADLSVPDTLFASNASHVAVDTPTSEPTNNTTNFPFIGACVFWRSGSDLHVTVRSATSTYITANVVTMA